MYVKINHVAFSIHICTLLGNHIFGVALNKFKNKELLHFLVDLWKYISHLLRGRGDYYFYFYFVPPQLFKFLPISLFDKFHRQKISWGCFTWLMFTDDFVCRDISDLVWFRSSLFMFMFINNGSNLVLLWCRQWHILPAETYPISLLNQRNLSAMKTRDMNVFFNVQCLKPFEHSISFFFFIFQC